MKFSAYRLVLLLAALLCVAGCRPSTHYVTVEGSVLGTTFRIKARTTLPADEIYTEVMALDEEMKHSMSIFDETSLLSRINRGESDSLDSHLIYNILAADSVSRLSDGMYDITVKPLVEAWGFAGKEGQKTPNSIRSCRWWATAKSASKGTGSSRTIRASSSTSTRSARATWST